MVHPETRWKGYYIGPSYFNGASCSGDVYHIFVPRTHRQITHFLNERLQIETINSDYCERPYFIHCSILAIKIFAYFKGKFSNMIQNVPLYRNLQPKKNLISDDYRITGSVLGLGINGKVVECYKKSSNQKCALKVYCLKRIQYNSLVKNKKGSSTFKLIQQPF